MEHFLTSYGAIGVFLGAAFEGQTALVVGGVLARQHLLALWLVLASAAAGSGLLDHLLFVAGRRYRSSGLEVRAAQQPAFAKALQFIERFPNSYILVFRFIFGLRLASPIAIGVSQIPTWRFTLLNIAGALLWSGVFTGLGYVFGEAVERVFGRHAGCWTLIAIGVLVAVVLLAWLARLVLRRRQKARAEAEEA